MEKLESDLAKFENARKKASEEEAKMIQAVDEYIESKVRQGDSREKIRRYYMKKYIDFLESSAVQPLDKKEKHKPLTPEQKFSIIKRQIYLHEIRPNMKKGSSDSRNAQ